MIGWGSLIWCNKSLSLASKWLRDGPSLPVEFARKSDDGRLTLVIVPGIPAQQTLWAVSAFDNLSGASADLRRREGGDATPIGVWSSEEKKADPFGIGAWCHERGFNGAIWTALKPRWFKGAKRPPSPDEAITYLKSLKNNMPLLKVAKEYICMAPAQINTVIRERVRIELDWKVIPLPSTLFEPD